MFDFRIIQLENGIEIIDPSLKTPIESLTHSQAFDYFRVQDTFNRIKRIRRKNKRYKRNLIYRLLKRIRKCT